MSLSEEIERYGGLVATHELRARGYGRDRISAALSSGQIWRVRKGWYCAAGLAQPLREAARVGGAATCATALRLHGAWAPIDERLHVAVLPDRTQLRSTGDSRTRLHTAEPVVVHWNLRTDEGRLLRSPIASLLDLVACAPPEYVGAAADSLVQRRLLSASEWTRARALFPARLIPVIDLVDGVCESGSEFVFWTRIGRVRASARRQVVVAGVGRVDFLFGERLVVEVDGRAHHTDPGAFESDRRRDALLSAHGFRVLRFSYRQVFEDWPSVESALFASFARGDLY